jgi:hypothetical protein
MARPSKTKGRINRSRDVKSEIIECATGLWCGKRGVHEKVVVVNLSQFLGKSDPRIEDMRLDPSVNEVMCLKPAFPRR